MKNLIELSKILSEFTTTNGIPDYSILLVTRELNDKKYHYDIMRTKEGGHIVTVTSRINYEERKYSKVYNNAKQFEDALKRIQKMDNITKVTRLG